MVTRACLRHTWGYLSPGICSLNKPSAMVKWCHFTPKSTQSCYDKKQKNLWFIEIHTSIYIYIYIYIYTTILNIYTQAGKLANVGTLFWSNTSRYQVVRTASTSSDMYKLLSIPCKGKYECLNVWYAEAWGRIAINYRWYHYILLI